MTQIIKKENYTFTDKLFLFIWTFYSVSAFILESELGIDYSIGLLKRTTTYATILMQILMLIYIKRYKLGDIFKYAAVLSLIFMVEINNTDSVLLVYVLFIILAQYIDIDKLLRYDILLKVCILAVIVGMCFIGVTSNYSRVINGTYKQAWGFSHPNVFTVYTLIILLEWLCVRYRKMKWYEWVLIAGSTLVIMQIGAGRTSSYTFIGIYLLFIVATLFPKLLLSEPAEIFFTIITPIMAVLSFLTVWLYNQGNAAVIALDSIMTYRISSSARFLNNYNVTLFGQEIEYIGSRTAQTTGVTSAILDNAYVRCMLDWGIFVFAIIIIAYIFLMRELLKKERIELALLCLFFVLLGFGETYLLKPIYNVTLLCILGFHSKGKANEMMHRDRH